MNCVVGIQRSSEALNFPLLTLFYDPGLRLMISFISHRTSHKTFLKQEYFSSVSDILRMLLWSIKITIVGNMVHPIGPQNIRPQYLIHERSMNRINNHKSYSHSSNLTSFYNPYQTLNASSMSSFHGLWSFPQFTKLARESLYQKTFLDFSSYSNFSTFGVLQLLCCAVKCMQL